VRVVYASYVLRRRPTDQAAATAAPQSPAAGNGRAPETAAKGRPTPSRKEAEAARKAYLGGLPADPKARRRAERDQQREAFARQRQAVRTGDTRHYPERDRGPARAFVRDYVDGRLRLLEFLMPLVVLSWLTIFVHQTMLYIYASFVMEGAVVLGVALSILLTMRIKREVRAKFGEEHVRGAGFYAFSRALMPRPMRQPKPVVRAGGAAR
jgi:Protein of unknown function (DUF3043)